MKIHIIAYLSIFVYGTYFLFFDKYFSPVMDDIVIGLMIFSAIIIVVYEVKKRFKKK
jgi:hypothetical protein